MAIQGSKEETQYLLGKFITRQEAESAGKALRGAGFLAEKISIDLEPLNTGQDTSKSQAIEGGKGGAIAGAVFGGMVGLLFSLMTNNIPVSTTFTFSPYLHPLLGIVIGSIIGAAGIGLMGAITGRNVPKTKPEIEGGALTHEYRITLTGTEEEGQRASDILRQADI